jgi:hypothetical protein
LELYKSLDGKISLLDEAIKLGDGDTLITVGFDASSNVFPIYIPYEYHSKSLSKSPFI